MDREFLLEAYCAYPETDIEGVCYSLPFIVRDSCSKLCYFCDSGFSGLSSLRESNLSGFVLHFVKAKFLVNPEIHEVFQDGKHVFIANRGDHLLNQRDVIPR